MTLHTNPEWQALLRGICAEPYDDLRRLVAADWLTEHGEEEYAEFVRVQVEGGDATEPTPDLGDWLDSLPPNTAYTTCESSLTLTAPAVLVRRGFVDVVRAPLSWLIGGECDRCAGTGIYTDNEIECPTCHGTGRTPAHLDELVRSQPITRVVVVDREPYTAHFQDRYGWRRGDGGFVDRLPDERRDELPNDVFDAIGGSFVTHRLIKWFYTRESALDALSLALLIPARERAGLPALHPAATLEVVR
jgi:uncharacterized protein (TIGR02996 family)